MRRARPRPARCCSSSEAELADPFANEWVRERVLGEGGMGTVYLVRNRTSGLRFAMKQIRADLLQDAERRRMFFAELQTWIGLPEHPNLATCRFFRTVADEVAVFTDVAEGGSLRDWIAARRLPGAAALLDVAIQFAWGLQAAHDSGVLHQDVKPANVLMTASGVPRVADFGLASTLGTSQGLTLAYSSPEQSAGRALTAQADQWSFAVSVLEMFTGEVTWMSGVVAPHVLEEWRRQPDPGGHPLPEAAAEVLERCLAEDPRQRWPDLGEAAEGLRRAWEGLRGRPYPRVRPVVARAAAARDTTRSGSTGGRWRDPAQALAQALQRAGRPARGAPRAALDSARGRLVAELADMTEAVRIYEGLPAPTPADEVETGYLLEELSALQQAADDLPGALASSRRAEAHWQRLCARPGRVPLGHLGRVLLNQAILVSASGAAAALPLYDRALQATERMAAQGEPKPAADLRMRVFISQAIALNELGRAQEALPLLEQATAWLTDGRAPADDRQEATGVAFAALANAHRLLGRRQEATAIGRRIVAYYEGTPPGPALSVRHGLACALLNLGVDLAASAAHEEAHAVLDRAVALWNALADEGSLRDLEHERSRALAAKAALLGAQGDWPAAEPLFARAVALLERRVQEEAAHHVSALLTDRYGEYADCLFRLGKVREALALEDRALAVFTRLSRTPGVRDQRRYTATCRRRRARAFGALGDSAAAEREQGEAVRLLQEAVDAGQVALVHRAAGACAELAELVRPRDAREAVRLCDRALQVLDAHPEQEGRAARAMARLNRGSALAGLGENAAAVEDLGEASDLYAALAAEGDAGAADSRDHALYNQSQLLSDDRSAEILDFRQDLIAHLERRVNAGAVQWRQRLVSCCRTQAAALAGISADEAERTLDLALAVASAEPPILTEVAAVRVLRAYHFVDEQWSEQVHRELAALELVLAELTRTGHDVSRFRHALQGLTG